MHVHTSEIHPHPPRDLDPVIVVIVLIVIVIIIPQLMQLFIMITVAAQAVRRRSRDGPRSSLRRGRHQRLGEDRASAGVFRTGPNQLIVLTHIATKFDI